MSEQPPDLTLAESVVAMHEMYTNMRQAGFTDQQAMYLVARLMRPQCDCGGSS